MSLVNFNSSYISSGLLKQPLNTPSFNFGTNFQASIPYYNFTHFSNQLLNSLNNFSINSYKRPQKTLNTSFIGSLGNNSSTTLNNAGYNEKAGKRLANIAAQNTVGFRKQCATYVKKAISKAGLGEYESGKAYECVNILKRNPNFKEISTTGLNLSNLPAGCVLVYDRGVSGYSREYGHIEITLGNGQAVSDGVTNNIRQGARVFVPVSKTYIA